MNKNTIEIRSKKQGSKHPTDWIVEIHFGPDATFQANTIVRMTVGEMADLSLKLRAAAFSGFEN